MKQKWLSIIVLALILLLSFGGLAGAQTKTLYWQRYDVDITVLLNGNLRVVETQELVFTSGSFSYGQRAISLYRLDNISDVTVSELNGPEYKYSDMDAPYTFRTFEEGGDLKVRYNFPATGDSRRTISAVRITCPALAWLVIRFAVCTDAPNTSRFSSTTGP